MVSALALFICFQISSFFHKFLSICVSFLPFNCSKHCTWRIIEYLAVLPQLSSMVPPQSIIESSWTWSCDRRKFDEKVGAIRWGHAYSWLSVRRHNCSWLLLAHLYWQPTHAVAERNLLSIRAQRWVSVTNWQTWLNWQLTNPARISEKTGMQKAGSGHFKHAVWIDVTTINMLFLFKN